MHVPVSPAIPGSWEGLMKLKLVRKVPSAAVSISSAEQGMSSKFRRQNAELNQPLNIHTIFGPYRPTLYACKIV